MIGIVDYGAGNLASVHNAFERIGEHSEVFEDSKLIDKYDRIVLPGVGSFSRAMHLLTSKGWKEAILNHINDKKPFLGICLGMQILIESGDEKGPCEGLGVIKGKVKLLNPSSYLKIPHVGWNNLLPSKEHPVMEGIKENIDFYFVHSYRCIPESKKVILSECDYGGKFVSSVSKDNVIGMQFHPEKSQPVGLKILKNFSNWDGKC